MKWSEMSVFHKITVVVGLLCAVVYGYIAVFSLWGLLPSVYAIPWAQVLLGICWVGQAILNWKKIWKKMRVLAIINLVVGLLAFATAFLGWFIK